MNFKEISTSIRSRDKIKKLVLPGFDGIPISHVITFVLKGFRKGVLVTRASSIAFNLLMALLPASIFLFTLIPFVPIPNFQEELIRLFESILPANAFNFLETTIIDIITKRAEGYCSLCLLPQSFFQQMGFMQLFMHLSFQLIPLKPDRGFNQRKISIVLLLIVVLMISIAGFLVIFGKMAVNRLVEIHILERNLVIYVLDFPEMDINNPSCFSLQFHFSIILLLQKETDFRFFSPGSTLATLLFILTSLGFSAYVNNFGQYNKLYGSMGTLMVVLVWLYLNSIAILIGFELNVSIMAARAENIAKASPFSCNEETQ